MNLKSAPIAIRKAAGCYGIFTGVFHYCDHGETTGDGTPIIANVVGGQPIRGNTRLKLEVNLTQADIDECAAHTWNVIRQ